MSKSKNIWERAGVGRSYSETIGFTVNYSNETWEPPTFISLLLTEDSYNKYKDIHFRGAITSKELLKLATNAVGIAHAKLNEKPPHEYPNAEKMQEDKTIFVKTILEKEKFVDNLKTKILETDMKLVENASKTNKGKNIEL
jgi:hypothetical protein